jgi:hypothetical protein
MSDVVQFTVKRKDRNEREFSSWSSSQLDLTSLSDAVLDTLGRAMLQSHGYCHLSIINELTHRAEHHQKQGKEIRDNIASRNVERFLKEHLNESMVDPKHAMRIIENAIDLDDVTKGRIWFTDEEYKVNSIDQAYEDIMCLATVYASDCKLEAEAKSHEHRSKLLAATADNFTNGRLVILTAVGQQIVYCSTNRN